MAMVGLATKLKKVRKEEIFKARLAMEEKLLLAQIENSANAADQIHRVTLSERATQMRARLMDAQAKIRQMHDDYLAAKKAFVVQGQQKMRRAELKMAKIEFKSAYTQWRTFRKAVSRTMAA